MFFIAVVELAIRRKKPYKNVAYGTSMSKYELTRMYIMKAQSTTLYSVLSVLSLYNCLSRKLMFLLCIIKCQINKSCIWLKRILINAVLRFPHFNEFLIA
jgi:hypothetical protein